MPDLILNPGSNIIYYIKNYEKTESGLSISLQFGLFCQRSGKTMF